MTPTLMAESEEELKNLLMEVKEESEKTGLKLNIQKMKIVATSLITSWQVDQKTTETVRDFIFLGSKISADGDRSREIKRCLLLEINKPRIVLKSRDISLLTKVHIGKAMIFLVVMCGCESCSIKKDERRRIDTFELWCWRRLQSSLDSKEIKSVNPKGNQPGIFIGRTDAEALILWPSDVKSRLIGNDPDAGKD